ncbi:MAG: tyrosine--tRNA ligase [Candidatus Gracilibacteria bacterium]|nr:tyrosine--tRNA ligase [Candidatus Gracilibacteria bacterium]
MIEKKEIIKNLLEKGVSNVIDKKNLEEKLNSEKILRIKFGIDPTGTQVHIGHAVPILKLREFQKLGHQIVIIIGDATAQVGDTSDKTAERPMLTRKETLENASDYLKQFGKILDIEKVEVRFNSEWMDKTSFNLVGELAKNFSVAEMLDRDNFSKRYKDGVRISLQEFLYPIMQGYDSVMINADVELGGNDQYFNLLAGRKLQEAHGQEKQNIMTFNLIEGTDGRKMSKTYKNFVGLDFKANDMFVKIMEIGDELIIKYFQHCTSLYFSEIQKYQDRLDEGENPRNIKLELAFEIVKLYHGETIAIEAKEYFQKVIKEGIVPDEKDIEKMDIDTTGFENQQIPLASILSKAGLVNNTTEARNALNGNSVKVNNEIQNDPKFMITLDKKNYILLQVGKKKFRMVK